MANKARYYGLATREERQDVSRQDNAAKAYPATLGYAAVVAAILNYKQSHPNFDNLSATAAASAIAKELTKQGTYGHVSSGGGRIKAPGYSIALTKSKNTIVASKASEQINSDQKKKK